VYPVHFVLSALDNHGERIDLDTTRQFAVQRELGKGQFVSGIMEMPVPSGNHTVSVLTEQDGAGGAVATIPEVRVPGTASEPWISSVLLGLEGSRITWNSGTMRVPLHPLNAYARNQSVELYYQLGGLRPGSEYRTRVELHAMSDASESPALAVSFSDGVAATHIEVQRSIGLQNLEPGQYRLRVTVAGAGHEVSAVSRLTVAPDAPSDGDRSDS
jgi:hypothetical protein